MLTYLHIKAVEDELAEVESTVLFGDELDSHSTSMPHCLENRGIIQVGVVGWKGGIPLGQCSTITHMGLTKAVSAREACLVILDDNVQVFYASSLWVAEMIFQSGL
ncbi:hypothetical protein FQN60_017124 [Etheostoma spectabile]|uniref:Uncharacterized protein n=1 Tax=Etheostoma spectabile TaxID=54343 RepID=A0A5J5DEL0_9PERO|nr:hypothetical protein FQN60_017124 [Etheostoma spectabile]